MVTLNKKHQEGNPLNRRVHFTVCHNMRKRIKLQESLSDLPSELNLRIAMYLPLKDVASFRLVKRFKLHPVVWSHVVQILENRVDVNHLNTLFEWWGIPYITLGAFLRGDTINVLHVNRPTTVLPYLPNHTHLLRQGEYPDEPEYYQYPGGIGFLRLTHIPKLSLIDQDGFNTPP